MNADPIIQFAQDRFGLHGDAGLRGPARLPTWVQEPRLIDGEIIDGAANLVLEAADPDLSATAPVPDGTTPDSLAYYLPFHFYRTRWGIYIRASGVLALARRLSPVSVDPAAIAAAHLVLLEHERCHFVCEYGASRTEAVCDASRYHEYFRNRPASEFEEALANADAFRALLRTCPRFGPTLARWMKTQPAGYRDFDLCLPPQVRSSWRRAAALMNAPTNSPATATRALPPAEFLFRAVRQSTVPTYWVHDIRNTSVDFVRLFPRQFGLQVLVHSNDHKPPHIHIQVPPGTERTRYRWPELTPVDGDPALRRGERRNLERYLAMHSAAIAARVTAVPWK